MDPVLLRNDPLQHSRRRSDILLHKLPWPQPKFTCALYMTSGYLFLKGVDLSQQFFQQNSGFESKVRSCNG